MLYGLCLSVVLFAQDSWFLLLKKLELVSFWLHLSQMPFITIYHILAEKKVNILHELGFAIQHVTVLTFFLMSPDISSLENSLDPDQLASDESTLFSTLIEKNMLTI